MWALMNVNDPEKIYYLKSDLEHVVGRVGTGNSLELEKDDSISRNHCKFTIERGKIYIEDLKSKYGTYLNEQIKSIKKIDPGKKIELSQGDKIMFGRLNNIWLLSKIDYRILTSNVPDHKKQKLNEVFQRLSFSLANDWSENCTHLTMATKTVITLKLVRALVECIPIVTPQFWIDVFKAIGQNKPFPDYRNFIPKISEPYLTAQEFSLEINENRKKLFAGKTLVFMYESQMEPYADIIRLAGGNCLSINKSKLTKKTLIGKQYICIQSRTQSSQSQMSQRVLDDIKSYLAKNGIRLVPEQEIGTAILKCCIKDFCNPKKKFDENFIPNSMDQKIAQSKTVAKETEETVFTEQPVSSGIMIPETQDSTVMNLMTLSEKLPDSEAVESMSTDTQPDQNTQSQRQETVSNVESQLMPPPPPPVPAALSPAPLPIRLNKNVAAKRKAPQETATTSVEGPKRKQMRSEPPASSQAAKTNAAKKRPIRRKYSDDEDEDELFNFDENVAKKHKIYVEPSAAVSKPKQNMGGPMDSGIDLVDFAPSADSENMTSKILKPISLNIPKIDVKTLLSADGWLSKDFKKLSTNSQEPLQQIKEEPTDETEDNKEFVRKAISAFEVNVVVMDLKSNQSLMSCRSELSGSSMSSNKKNFKAFVKKYNYKTQSLITPTITVGLTCDDSQNETFG